MKTSWKNRRDLFNLLGKNLLKDWGCLFDISGSLNIPSIWNETLTFRITTSIIDNRLSFLWRISESLFFLLFYQFSILSTKLMKPSPIFTKYATFQWERHSTLKVLFNCPVLSEILSCSFFINKTYDILANTNTWV